MITAQNFEVARIKSKKGKKEIILVEVINHLQRNNNLRCVECGVVSCRVM